MKAIKFHINNRKYFWHISSGKIYGSGGGFIGTASSLQNARMVVARFQDRNRREGRNY